MKIYNQEIKDGLSDSLSNRIISYDMPMKIIQDKDFVGDVDKLCLSVANTKIEDLFYFSSILCTTSWNLNDDVFSAQEMWKAKSTPVNKPLNVEHRQNEIIGHITSSYPVDQMFLPINPELSYDSIPESYHILTQAVIYKAWENMEYEDQIHSMINDIQNGGWFVSMECLFNEFDYAVQTPLGESLVIKRDEDSSYLTKHLRCYGGTGFYKSYKLGRMPKDFVFSGKGLVRKPANPYSIIFNNVQTFKGVAKELVYIEDNSNTLNNWSSEMEEVEKLTNELANRDKVIADLKEQVSELNRTKASELEGALHTSKEANVELIKTVASLENEKKALAHKIIELTDSYAALRTEFDKLVAIQKAETRKKMLIEAGMTEDLSEGSVKAFVGVADPEFEAIVAAIAAVYNTSKEKVNEEPNVPVKQYSSPKDYVDAVINSTPKSNSPHEGTVQAKAEEVLDNLKISEDLTVTVDTSDADSTEKARAELAIENLMLNKFNKKRSK